MKIQLPGTQRNSYEAMSLHRFYNLPSSLPNCVALIDFRQASGNSNGWATESRILSSAHEQHFDFNSFYKSTYLRSSPFHCRQPSIFGCWPAGMELPATGGHVGAISDNLPHSTQDVSVHWVISWHSAHLIFLSTHCGPSSVLNT